MLVSTETSNGSRSPLKVLLVEDDADAAQSLALLLQLNGHRVQLASCGASAVALAEADPPQVVLLDLGLPDINGYEVARRLRARGASQRPLIIAVTGYAEQPERLQSYEAGIDLHLVKPVQFGELEQVLGRYQAVTRGA
jgi:two-component system CheB/CheR fusion protein